MNNVTVSHFWLCVVGIIIQDQLKKAGVEFLFIEKKSFYVHNIVVRDKLTNIPRQH